MGKKISLFSGYSQKENRTTNYCLLALKMIYDENPKYLSDVLTKLVDYDMSGHVGVDFNQQKVKSGSTPDGVISQKSFIIYIETKNFDWFYDSQLERHLEELNKEESGIKVLIALGKFEMSKKNRFSKIDEICKSKYKGKILFAAAGFDNFIDAFYYHINTLEGNGSWRISERTKDAISDFRLYLDEQNLLPSWKNRLDIVNCGKSASDIIENHVYTCPAKGGSYSHKRSKYFGLYRNKRVEYVSLIRAIVDVDSKGVAEFLWNNTHEENEDIKNEAVEKVKNLDWYPVRVFLLDNLYETNFEKDSKGGMFGSKKYMDVSSLNTDDVKLLANHLNGKKWSEL